MDNAVAVPPGNSLFHGWGYEVTPLSHAIDRHAMVSRILLREFAPRYGSAAVDISGFDLTRYSGDTLVQLVNLKYDVAFMSLEDWAKRMWAHEVIPGDIPSGE